MTIQLNKKQFILSLLIVSHLVIFANVYYLLVFGEKGTAIVRSFEGGYDGAFNKYITFQVDGQEFEFKESLDRDLRGEVPVIYDPSNPNNHYPFTFRNFWFERIVLSLLTGVTAIMLIQIFIKKYRYLTFKTRPFSLSISTKNWDKKEEQKLATFLTGNRLSTIKPFEYYHKILTGSNDLEGIYKTILRDLYLHKVLVMQMQGVQISKHDSKMVKKPFLGLNENVPTDVVLSETEKEVLHIFIEHGFISISEIQRLSKQQFGKEYKQLNEMWMKKHFGTIKSEQITSIQQIATKVTFIETHIDELLGNHTDALISLIESIEESFILLSSDVLVKILKHIPTCAQPELYDTTYQKIKTLIHFDLTTSFVKINGTAVGNQGNNAPLMQFLKS